MLLLEKVLISEYAIATAYSFWSLLLTFGQCVCDTVMLVTEAAASALVFHVP